MTIGRSRGIFDAASADVLAVAVSRASTKIDSHPTMKVVKAPDRRPARVSRRI